MDMFGAGSGEKYFESLGEIATTRGGQPKTQTEAAFSSSRATSKAPTRTTSSGGDNSNQQASSKATANAGSRGVGQETSGTSSSKAKAQTAARQSGVSAKTAASLSGQQSTNPGGFDKEKGNWASGPMNKGGLVKRRSKKSKK